MPYEGFEELDEGVHRDLHGRLVAPWGRRVLLTVLGVIVIAALVNLFGQHAIDSSARGSSGALDVTAPKSLRAGDIYQVNPTTLGHRRTDAQLADGATLVARVHRTLTIFP
jgi:hypothetical protein